MPVIDINECMAMQQEKKKQYEDSVKTRVEILEDWFNRELKKCAWNREYIFFNGNYTDEEGKKWGTYEKERELFIASVKLAGYYVKTNTYSGYLDPDWQIYLKPANKPKSKPWYLPLLKLMGYRE